jgi:hypothetical protein
MPDQRCIVNVLHHCVETAAAQQTTNAFCQWQMNLTLHTPAAGLTTLTWSSANKTTALSWFGEAVIHMAAKQICLHPNIPQVCFEKIALKESSRTSRLS